MQLFTGIANFAVSYDGSLLFTTCNQFITLTDIAMDLFNMITIYNIVTVAGYAYHINPQPQTRDCKND